MKILVVGASRGLGLEFVRQCRARGDEVFATARTQGALQVLRGLGATAHELDVADAASASRLAWALDGWAFDRALYVAGVYGPRTQGLATVSQADFDAVMHTNVLGAMWLLPQMAEALAPKARLAVVSSRMGSMASRASSSGWLYRASKAALNSLLVDAATELQDKALCVALHPGWVRTDMGGAGADLTPEQSVAGMLKVLEGLTPDQHGSFINVDGSPIDW